LVDPTNQAILWQNAAFLDLVELEADTVAATQLAEIWPEFGTPVFLERLREVAVGAAGEEHVRVAPPAKWHSNGPPANPLIELVVKRVRTSERPLVALFALPNASSKFADHRDALTGLPDRTVLAERVEARLRGDRLGDGEFALLLIDLDGFKQVNDQWGHLAGDDVLVEAANRLVSSLRDGDLLVRYGGDEFVAMVERISSIGECTPIIERMSRSLERPIMLAGGPEVRVDVSVGVAVADGTHQDLRELIRRADREMYQSKRAFSARRK
jgi:diguanylate cyclase (GGDEF)-like protein